MKAEVEEFVLPGERTTRSFLSLSSPDRRAFLLAVDLLALNAGLAVSLAFRKQYELNAQLLLRYPLWFILLSLLWLLWARAFDAYDLRLAGRFGSSARAVFLAGALTVGIYLLIPYITPPLPSSRSALFAFPLLAFAFLLVGRGLYCVALTQPAFHRRVLIIGAGWAGRTIAEALAGHGDGTYQVVGFVDDDPAKLGKGAWEIGNRGEFTSAPLHVCTRAPKAPQHLCSESTPAPPPPGTSAPLLVLGNRHSLPALIRQHRVDTLILAITHDVNGELLQTLMDCLELGVEIVPMPVLYEQLTSRVPVEHVGSNWYVAMPLDHPQTKPLNRAVKRAFDIVGAALGLLFLALAFPFIALAIYLDSPGPIFYTQERVGQGGRVFKVYKFRSMVPNAEQGRAVWAQENDPRVTRVGRILRKAHIDEFPQFLNILKGEMSAVGPRPERPEFVEELAREIPFYRVRHAVKPGMAGWGLVKQGYGSSKEDALLKLQYDLYYIKHQSLWLDLVILLKTIVDTFTLQGR
ncbi:MAG: sugar transferase [Chloroflexi bacterium]|nr:sugar transferase [Chloroflexota bacterium]